MVRFAPVHICREVRLAFTLADADGNGALALDESTAALNHLTKRLGVPLQASETQK